MNNSIALINVSRLDANTVLVVGNAGSRAEGQSLAWAPAAKGKQLIAKLVFVQIGDALVAALKANLVVKLASESAAEVTDGSSVTVACSRVDDNRAKAFALSLEQYRGYRNLRKALKAEGKITDADDLVVDVPMPAAKAPVAEKPTVKFAPKAPEGIVQTTPIKSNLKVSPALAQMLVHEVSHVNAAQPAPAKPASALVVTNRHVVSPAEPVNVEFGGNDNIVDATNLSAGTAILLMSQQFGFAGAKEEPVAVEIGGSENEMSAPRPKRRRNRGGRNRNRTQGANVVPQTEASGVAVLESATAVATALGAKEVTRTESSVAAVTASGSSLLITVNTPPVAKPASPVAKGDGTLLKGNLVSNPFASLLGGKVPAPFVKRQQQKPSVPRQPVTETKPTVVISDAEALDFALRMNDGISAEEFAQKPYAFRKNALRQAKTDLMQGKSR